MSSQPLCFFTIDRGTATTAAAVLGPVAGRYRLLGAAVAPSRVPADALLEDLAWRVAATDPELLPPPGSWPEWARLEVASRRPRRVVCVAPMERDAVALERTLVAAGWTVSGVIVGTRHDPLAATELCLDASTDVLVVLAPESPSGDEAAAAARVAPLLDAVARRRPDLPWLLCGGGELPGLAIGGDRVGRLPGLSPGPPGLEGPLRDALRILGRGTWSVDSTTDPGHGLPDPRDGLRAAVATLADLLDRRVEAVDIGATAGTRILADPGVIAASVTITDAALIPEGALRDDRQLDDVVRWTAVRADPFTLSDRLRNLGVAPWRDASGDGARLRLAALRAALSRLEVAWRDATTDGRSGVPAADLLVCSGGAFAAMPPAAAALAVVDTLRRPGALTLFHDHARILAPIGALADDGDRRRLLADLLDDALLPLGSAIVAGEVRTGPRHGATLRVTSALQQQEIELAPGVLRLVDLPPGVSARVELETRAGDLLGVRARKLALDVTGGLGGLLVDTREVPLRLPDRPERRRALLEAWERPVWASAETWH